MSGEIAKRDGYAGLIERSLPAIQKMLPKALGPGGPERFARVAISSINRNPYLQRCTPMSLAGAVVEAATLGLEVDGRGHAYLVPYKDNQRNVTNAQLQIGYKGLCELAYRSGKISHIYAEVVYRHEVEQGRVSVAKGMNADIRHEIDILDGFKKEDGGIVGAYCVVVFKDGQRYAHWVDRQHIDKRKAASKARSGPWQQWFPEMCQKTAVKDALRTIQLSADIQHATVLDDQAEAGEPQEFQSEVVVSVESSKPTTGEEATYEAVANEEPPEEQAGLITDAQRKTLMAYYKGWARDKRMEHAFGFIGHEINSFSELTKNEASMLIDAWKNHEQK